MRVALLLLASAAAWAQSDSWTPELSMKVQTIGDAVPSPDGQLVAYVQTRALMEPDKSEMLGHIFLARADGSHRIQLTRGEKSASAPAFSPDGKFVYFQSSRSGKPNLWRIPVDGGEAERLTDWKGAIGSYRISPNGKWVAFAGSRADEDAEKRAKEKRDFRVVDATPNNHSFWLIPAEGGAEPRAIGNVTVHIADFDWSPDSRSIAFHHMPRPSADNWPRADISEIEVETGQVRVLAATGAAEVVPRYSPDGKYLAYVRSAVPVRWAGEAHLMVLPRTGGEPRALPDTADEKPILLGWSRDSSRLAFYETRGATNALYTIGIDAPAKALHQPAEGALGGGTLNITGTHVGFGFETSVVPPEAYVLALSGGNPVRVSAANTGMAMPPLGESRRVTWKSKDGLAVEGLLTYPVGYEKGKKYPLVLVIHGGPMGVFTETFLGRFGPYPLATIAARGYAVLRPNPRGSSGYGRKFRLANLADWGGKDYEDIMAGVDHVVSMGVADPERLAVMGWSYGGFMTSWTIGHTKRFKAAAVGAGVTNLWSFTGTADIPGFLPDYFGGQPWDNLDIYRKHSPMSYVGNVTTPTLILHGEADDRVPISQGFELYNALKQRGVTTRMVVYPRTPHGPQEPKFILDIMHRHLDWIDKYVK